MIEYKDGSFGEPQAMKRIDGKIFGLCKGSH